MTRKRFIKLIMSYEIPRNKAEKLASLVARHKTYEQAFWEAEPDLRRKLWADHPERWISLFLITAVIALDNYARIGKLGLTVDGKFVPFDGPMANFLIEGTDTNGDESHSEGA